MANTFSLYDDKSADKFYRRFAAEWKNFLFRVKDLREEFEKDGANDTASRDFQLIWIEKHAADIHGCGKARKMKRE